MGNQMSVPQRVEDQENEPEAETYQDNASALNGVPVVVSTHTVQHLEEVDLGISVKTDNVATSSPETTEISAVADANGKNLGKEAKPEAPAAKSRFFLMLSRPVPGRTGDQAADSSLGSVKLDVSSNKAPANKDPSESWTLPVAAGPGQDTDKTPGHAPAQDKVLSAARDPTLLPPETGGAGGEAPSKPKDSSFFDKFFKLDKGQEKVPGDSQQEAKRAEHQDKVDEVPGLSGQSDDVPAGKDIVDGKEKEGQELGTADCSVPGDPEGLETAKDDSQAAAIAENNNSIMSFFKTLVSPNKAETKKDPEDTGAEKSPTTSADLKSDKANFTSQETQGAGKNSKGCNPSGHTQSVTTPEPAKEGTKEKSGPTSLPLGKLFWKKSVKEDSVPTGAEENVVCESPVEIIKSKEVESALQTVDLNEGDAAPEPTEAKLKREESKPRTSLMAFLRQMTSDSTEKTITPPEPEPTGAPQKGKEGSSKDKKSAAEMNKQKSNKQEAKEPAQCTEQATVDTNSLQNGDKLQKRPEKRQQSLGGFFKGLGPKRMLDAQVQTDPVSIGPVGKSK
ncbi:breast carcinoma-amplified sequence 1 isoform 4 [Homo sapiens]|uniref:breast carcinoma-amplified sequence 1 isoform 4 n=1 Tax=Homo sapiens TaxID=9606 RepID=UPI0007DC6855|nr:breast carcinoma-amplified sequence 1 isoform 4 [Homo sapiens]XP_047296523.1 breast carcinoma-amplified sequence 1 isoform X7 [Homo sapiens]|eukprot:XP_016883599.1 breast carcinoma-amplified sequence 1 isoform X7 [Homo sapiens]